MVPWDLNYLNCFTDVLDGVDPGNRILTGHKPEPRRGIWKPLLLFWDTAVLYRVKCLVWALFFKLQTISLFICHEGDFNWVYCQRVPDPLLLQLVIFSTLVQTYDNGIARVSFRSLQETFQKAIDKGRIIKIIIKNSTTLQGCMLCLLGMSKVNILEQ